MVRVLEGEKREVATEDISRRAFGCCCSSHIENLRSHVSCKGKEGARGKEDGEGTGNRRDYNYF